MTAVVSREYTLEKRNTFFQLLCRLPEREIRPGPSVQFSSLVDLSQVEELRRAGAISGEKPSYTAFVVRAAALALKEFPYANRRVFRPWPFLAPRVQRFHRADIAVAIERVVEGCENVASVDVIREADSLSLVETTRRLRRMAALDEAVNPQWRTFRRLGEGLPDWFSSILVRLPVWLPALWPKYRGAAALVTSPAKYGVDSVGGTWAWPLGISFGEVAPRPLVKHGRVEVRPTFHLGLSFDRRVMAGAQAARFFRRVTRALENAHAELENARAEAA